MPDLAYTMPSPLIYALDFDGVICDSAVETAITGWKAAGRLWPDMPAEPDETLVKAFRQVRPIIETGYEAILAMRLLFLGESCDDIYRGFAERSLQLMQQTGVEVDELKRLFGEVRDRWIADDLADWITVNPLFPGVAEKLRRLAGQIWYVVTTKQERFVKQILLANRIELAEERIFGLERNMPKPEVLKGLIAAHPEARLHFVEDRLPTLLKVRQYPELAQVDLSLAFWGYNTADDKALADRQGFRPLQLDDFLATAAGA